MMASREKKREVRTRTAPSERGLAACPSRAGQGDGRARCYHRFVVDSPYGYLSVERDDDRTFLAWVSQLIDALDDPEVDDLVVVRIRNWFDHKWLRFSGIGRVEFTHVALNHQGVSLEALSQSKLTFPPFTPSRIVAETHFTKDREPFTLDACAGTAREISTVAFRTTRGACWLLTCRPHPK
jgi:hypothetical protein